MNIYVLNTMGIGIDIIGLIRKELNIKGIIGLSDRARTDNISDFYYQKQFCIQTGIDFIEVESYALMNEADKKKILELEIDVLLVTGWQRLVPQWFIQHCKLCVIGSHGSPMGITKGRGRSPQNWAFIMGMKTFSISIFVIDSNIDSGKIIETREFTFSDFDDIKTSYYKVCLFTAEMIIKNLKDENFKLLRFKEQDDEDAEYLPQRTPEDGAIDWTRTNIEIRNFVRALTRPYPGAHSAVNGHKIKIWSVIPFDIELSREYEIGTIVELFGKKDILVKTKESFMLIDDYEVENDHVLTVGLKMDCASFIDQMKNIIDRHEKKYPELPVSSLIKKIAGRNK